MTALTQRRRERLAAAVIDEWWWSSTVDGLVSEEHVEIFEAIAKTPAGTDLPDGDLSGERTDNWPAEVVALALDFHGI